MYTTQKIKVLHAINQHLGTELRIHVEVNKDNFIVYRIWNKEHLVVQDCELDRCLRSFFDLLHLGEVT